MRRRLLNLLTALSLLLFVAACVLWVRSYYYWDTYYWAGPNGSAGYTSNWGGFLLSRSTVTDPAQWPVKASGFHCFSERRTWEMGVGIPTLDPGLGRPWALRWGSREQVVTQSGDARGAHFSQIYLRHWMPAAASAFALLPLMTSWVRRWRRTRLRRPGRCTACGYDLRATPDRCPECGHEPSPVGKVSGV